MGKIHESNKTWLQLSDALVLINLSGRATREAWKKDKPQQYIYFKKHAPPDLATGLTVHINSTFETEYDPSDADENTQDWIVYYSK